MEGFKGNEFEHPLVAGFEDHRRSAPRLEGLFPTQGAQAPAIPRTQAREAEFRPGRGKVVSSGPCELQKLEREFGADDVATEILRARATVAVAVEPGLRRKAARIQAFAQDVEFHRFGRTLRFHW